MRGREIYPPNDRKRSGREGERKICLRQKKTSVYLKAKAGEERMPLVRNNKCTPLVRK